MEKSAATAKIDHYKMRFQNRDKARKYAQRFERGAHRRINQREQRAVAEIFSGLNGIRSVLDVPSGAGRFLGVLGQSQRRVIEIDSAFEMLEIAQERAADLGVAAQAMQSDASRLPLRDGAVDCVFCNRLLHHILIPAERGLILQELNRVSQRYVVMSFFDYHVFGPVRRMLKTLKGSKPLYGSQPTRDQFFDELAQARFRVLRVVPTGPVWVSEKYLVLEKM